MTDAGKNCPVASFMRQPRLNEDDTAVWKPASAPALNYNKAVASPERYLVLAVRLPFIHFPAASASYCAHSWTITVYSHPASSLDLPVTRQRRVYKPNRACRNGGAPGRLLRLLSRLVRASEGSPVSAMHSLQCFLVWLCYPHYVLI
jgi:hypothetical protein